MQRREYEIYEELEGVLRELNEDERVDAIIVEGMRDKQALEEMGITKEILKYRSKFTHDAFVEHLRKFKCVVILTDYDRKGKNFNRKLTSRLEKEGLRVERSYRERIGEILGVAGFKTVESLRSLRKRAIAWEVEWK